ncbi:MerR family transcriptional regulator [Calidifontibacillus erzurumensis]|uniref:MerR family transcriptional regulator n=1 Tax=Calidifontibacillus erzurumensis TaxID=2741433 RepID=A0A8J8GK22_9BACI|nr:MerR family transcriptional regulator [Calidifontibacillus erzurumensis]NSL53218.1 MerR family transcriptional regulator [Calidifontibacillus erzurumensis]
MEYTVQKLAALAGISTRTLRYYDEIGLLKPARINSSGYRIYGKEEVDKLQQILFYRELGISLENIRAILTDPAFDSIKALREHHKNLVERRNQLDQLIANVEKTIATKEGRMTMSDKEKFEGFKRRMLDENEQKYGKEIREKYGEDAVKKSNEKWMNMTKEQYEAVTGLENSFKEVLAEAYQTGDPASELAQKAADLHKQWLTYFWTEYSKEAHAGLVQMYVDDERFTSYYDKEQPGTAAFLRDAVLIYTGMKK